MKNKAKLINLIAALIPALVLSILSIKPIDTLRTGKEIKLAAEVETHPVSERERETYLNYEIEKADLSDFSSEDRESFKREFPYGKKVYIYLAENPDGVYTVDKLSFTEDKSRDTYLVGRINYYEDKRMEEENEKFIEEPYEYSYENISYIYVNGNLKYQVQLEEPLESDEVLVVYKMKYEYAIFKEIVNK